MRLSLPGNIQKYGNKQLESGGIDAVAIRPIKCLDDTGPIEIGVLHTVEKNYKWLRVRDKRRTYKATESSDKSAHIAERCAICCQACKCRHNLHHLTVARRVGVSDIEAGEQCTDSVGSHL